jgi:hypothetical protein
MTIDERLEALVQTVELIGQMQKENEKAIAALVAAQAKSEKRMDRFVEATLHIGADFASRLQKLEAEGNG